MARYAKWLNGQSSNTSLDSLPLSPHSIFSHLFGPFFPQWSLSSKRVNLSCILSHLS